MSKQANKTLIGVFVVVAVAIGIAAILMFGSGSFFTETHRLVAFFEGSVKGLRVGAPVAFRGVQIGEVKAIELVFNRNDTTFWIPVLIEVTPERISEFGSFSKFDKGREEIDILVEKGLRAQLGLQSFVTGQLLINIDFFEDKPAHFIKPEIPEFKITYPEIPTIKTAFQEITQEIEHIKLGEIIKDVKKSIKGIEQFINSPKIDESLTGINETIKDVRALVLNVNAKVDTIGTNLDGAVSDARGLVGNLNNSVSNADKLIDDIDGEVESVGDTAEDALKSAKTAIQQAEKTLKVIEIEVDELSPIKYELNDTLREIAAAARSVRILADFLEQKPDSLLRGKGSSGGK